MPRSKSSNRKEEPKVEAQAEATQPKQPFEALYLQQMSREFADDLEKLRKANDFRGEKSVKILVDALKQGTACFGEEGLRKTT